jgi:hypothetical protein
MNASLGRPHPKKTICLQMENKPGYCVDSLDTLPPEISEAHPAGHRFPYVRAVLSNYIMHGNYTEFYVPVSGIRICQFTWCGRIRDL